MAIYRYKSLNIKGKKVVGSLHGQSSTDVAALLSNQGLFPLKIREKKVWIKRSLNQSQKIELIDQLAELLLSGLPLFESLELLLGQSSGPSYEALFHLYESVKNGENLSEAMSGVSIFDHVDIAFIKGGQVSGDLAGSLTHLKSFLIEKERLRKKMIGALIYPMVLMTLCFIAVGALLLFAVPSIESFIEPERASLLTKSVIGLSHFLQGGGSLILLGLIGSGTLFFFWRKELFFRLFLSIGPIHRLSREVQLGRYASLVGALVRSHISILEALLLSRAALHERELVKEMEGVEERLEHGEMLSGIFEEKARAKAFPLYLARMIAVGERSADLGGAFKRIGSYYTERSSRRLDLISQLVQPILLVIIGLFIGLVMLAILMPMTDLSHLE